MAAAASARVTVPSPSESVRGTDPKSVVVPSGLVKLSVEPRPKASEVLVQVLSTATECAVDSRSTVKLRVPLCAPAAAVAVTVVELLVALAGVQADALVSDW